VRVLSYNVHRWGDDRAALARVFAAARVDVALVQEAPTWFGTRRRRHAFAASVGMRYVAGSARNAVLVAEGIEYDEPRAWRVWRPFVRRRLRLVATQLPGGALGASVVHADRRVALVVCHLGLHTRGRQRELEQVLRGCASFGTPYLLCGDLNEEPGGPVWRRLAAEGLTDLGSEPTYPSSGPYKRIDGALVSPGLDARLIAIDAAAEDLAAASDHLPMLVELTSSG